MKTNQYIIRFNAHLNKIDATINSLYISSPKIYEHIEVCSNMINICEHNLLYYKKHKYIDEITYDKFYKKLTGLEFDLNVVKTLAESYNIQTIKINI